MTQRPGVRSVLSDFSDNTQGSLGFNLFGITIDSFGYILVVDSLSGSENDGLLFSIDGSGNRTVISDFSDPTQGPLGRDPIGVAVDSSGYILVTDSKAGTNGGVLFSIDPTSGNRIIISDFSDISQGPPGCAPSGITIDLTGNILVADTGSQSCDGDTPKGILFSIDPSTGIRTILSDFGDSTQGPLGENPTGVAVVPPDSDLNLDHFKCYMARIPVEEPGFNSLTVELSDQFEEKQTEVRKPKLMCNPVDKNGEGVNNPTAHLACYDIKDVRGQPRFQRRDVLISNQFGEQSMEIRKTEVLCVPSVKIDLGPSE